MKNKKIVTAAVLCIVCFLLIVNTIPLFAVVDPNTDSIIISTLNTISSQLRSIQNHTDGENSGNLAFMSQALEQTELHIWDNENQRWYTKTLSGTAAYLVESKGNVCGYAVSDRKIHITAWNKKTKKFSSLVRHADAIEIVPADGNFGYMTSSQQAAVWTPQTDRWNDTRMAGSLAKSAGSDTVD